AAAERVAVIQRVAVAGPDPGGKAAVRLERDHLGPALPGDLGGPVARAVVNDEDVGVGQTRVELVEHGGKVVLLVPGRKEDERVAGGHAPSVALAGPALFALDHSDEMALGVLELAHDDLPPYLLPPPPPLPPP